MPTARSESRSPASGTSGFIQVRGLTKRFGSFTAVDALDFDVEPGRVTGFLGPNGSGKTTTLRMLLGLVRPTSGSGTMKMRKPTGNATAAIHFLPRKVKPVATSKQR